MSFESDLRKAKYELEKTISKIFRLSTIQTFNSVVMLSAKKTGRFQGNWQATLNKPAINTLFDGVPVGQEINYIPDVATPLNMGKLTDTFFMSNNLDYAQFLKDNPSPKWLDIEMAKMPDYIERFAKKVT